MTLITLKGGQATEDIRLDRVQQFDEASRNFPIRETIGTQVERKRRFWNPGTVLDQGREGACVGFAWSAELSASPQRVRGISDQTALAVYRRAQFLDEWPGEQYSGTSVLAGAKAVTEQGFIGEYRWAFGIDDVIDTLVQFGPLVIGIDWYDGMYQTTPGVKGRKSPLLRKTGTKVGGHALLAVGYTPRARVDGMSGVQEVVYLRNSWGPDWGHYGTAAFLVSDLDALLRDGGEACVPTIRNRKAA